MAESYFYNQYTINNYKLDQLHYHAFMQYFDTRAVERLMFYNHVLTHAIILITLRINSTGLFTLYVVVSER